MSRRAAELQAKIPRHPRKSPVYAEVDSTRLKIFSEGEWKVRQHCVDKRRTWRKIHRAVDEAEGDIIGIEVTPADLGDNESSAVTTRARQAKSVNIKYSGHRTMALAARPR